MLDSAKSKKDFPLEASIPGGAAPLESILCTEELRRRPSRPPDYKKENRALVALASALVDSQSDILQTLAETILEVTQCDSSGISLLTKDGRRFYWPAIAGRWTPHIGGGTPRDFGPCGDVLDQNTTLLFRHFERRYTYFLPVTPLVEECLLVPFYVGGKPIGTIWAITHDDRRKFDAEDERLMSTLGQFASLAYQTLVSIDDLKFQIAAREKAETALHELANGLEAKIRRLLDSNIIGIFMWSLDGRIIDANEAFLRIVGYSRDDLVSGRMQWRDLTPAEWRDADDRRVAELKANGIAQPYEKEYFRKSGSRVPVLVGGALFEEGGDKGVAFVLDLTEQKRAQENLRESETRLQAFFENTPNVLFLKDRQGRYLYVNKEFKRAFRITEEQITGKKDDEMFSAEQASAFQANDRQVLEAGVPMEFEEVALQEDGPHTSIVQKFPLFNAEGDLYAIGGIATDITQRKQEESARHYIEERHRVVVETANDAVVSADESGEIQFANPATMRVFGYDPTELIGRPLTVLMPEFMRKLHENGFKRYLATGRRHINWQGTEFIGLRKKGQEFPLEVSFGELTQNGHRVFTAFIRDISERKQAEEERERLRRAQADLAHINRVTTLGEMTASIAHELGQPLSAIIANGSACLRWLVGDDPNLDEARGAAQRVIRDGNRASQVITRIRALVRKADFEKAPLDINQVIQEVINLTQHEAVQKGAALRTELAGELPLVLGDRVQLQQVILNLIMNGVEAMSSVADRPRELVVRSCRHESDQVLIAIQDSGVGIDRENLKKIFDPFYTTKSRGMGMGLTISRSIVENHGGRLWAVPNGSPGATFQFTILQYQ